MMSIEENKANIRQQVKECWNNGDFSAVTELISPDFIYHTPNDELTGYNMAYCVPRYYSNN